jgi:hypothetical protein
MKLLTWGNWCFCMNKGTHGRGLSFDFRVKPDGDHRGAFLYMGAFGHSFEVEFYDRRHAEDLDE